MEITFHAHHAVITERMRLRAERLVRRLSLLVHRVVNASVRFIDDGPMRRVELILHAAGGRMIVAEGRGRYFGPALSQAGSRLRAQVTHGRGARRQRLQKRRVARGASTALPLAS